MSKKRWSGSVTFNTASFLENGSGTLLKISREVEQGGGICLVASVLFLAFSIEAYLNHLGAELLPDLEKKKRLKWYEKLKAICEHLRMDHDLIENRLGELFEFRNRLAHGRT